MTGLLAAQRNGFAFDHFPQKTTEIALVTGPVHGSEAGDVIAYDIGDQAHGLDRQPREEDPHREVPRFADNLPSRLYSKAFQTKLSQLFPKGPLEHTPDQYTEVFTYVNKRLGRWAAQNAAEAGRWTR
jgi:hypothetical protein